MTILMVGLAVIGAILVAVGLAYVLMARNMPRWMTKPAPWADAAAVSQFPPQRYRLQGTATALMGAAFLVEAATNSRYPASLLAVPLFAASVATNMTATRFGGLGYRSRRAPWVIAAIAAAVVVVMTAVFVFLLSRTS